MPANPKKRKAPSRGRGFASKALISEVLGEMEPSCGSAAMDTPLQKKLRTDSLDPATHIACAFVLMMDGLVSVPRFSEPGFGNTQGSAVYNVFSETSTTDGFLQASSTYNAPAGGFMSGVPIYLGATGTFLELSCWQFADENQRIIFEHFNEKGRPVTYQWYDSNGSVDFTISAAEGVAAGVLESGVQAIQEDLEPCYAAYDPQIVANPAPALPNLTGNSIYEAGSVTAATGAQNPLAGPFAAHGVPNGIGVIPYGKSGGRRWIWHDGGNFPNAAPTAYSNSTNSIGFGPGQQIPNGVTATTSDGVVTGMIGIAWGTNTGAPPLFPAFTFEIWGYNERTPYRLGTFNFTATTTAWTAAEAGRVMMAITTPLPDYHNIRITAKTQVVGGSATQNTIQLRFFQISASHLYRHFVNAAWDDVWTKVNAHRAFGSAMRIHNGTQGNLGGGDVTDWQASLGSEWQAVADNAEGAFDFIQGKNKATQSSIGLENGAYSWLRPVQVKQAEYKEYVNKLAIAGGGSSKFAGAPGLPCALAFDLEARSFHVTTVQVPLVTGTVPKQKLNYYFGATGQWTTDGQYYEVAEGTFTPPQWEAGMRKMQDLCTLTDNVHHLNTMGQIFRSHPSYAKEYLKNAPRVMSGTRNNRSRSQRSSPV